MKFTDVIDTILHSDPSADWLQVSTGLTSRGAAGTTHLFLPDVHLRIEPNSDMFKRTTGEVHIGELKPEGEVLFRPFTIFYGATFIGAVSLYWFHERDPDTGKFPSLHPYLPTPRCGPDSCALACRLEYQIARILDPLGLVDAFMLKKGYVVESSLTGEQYLEGRRRQQRKGNAAVIALMARREQEAILKESLPPPKRHLLRRFVSPASRR